MSKAMPTIREVLAAYYAWCLLLTPYYGYSTHRRCSRRRLLTTSMLTHYLLWLSTGDAAEDGGVGRLGGEDARLEV